MSNAIVARTLELAQEMKLAMGGRSSDPVNPNFLTAAAMIAIHEDVRGREPQGATGVPLREDQMFVRTDGVPRTDPGEWPNPLED